LGSGQMDELKRRIRHVYSYDKYALYNFNLIFKVFRQLGLRSDGLIAGMKKVGLKR